MMINERPKSGWKRTWQNSGLTRNRTLACDERLNSGGSRGGTNLEVGEGLGGPGSHPYFSTKMRPEVPKKIFFRDRAPLFLRVWMTGTPPPPLYLKVWIRHCLTCPKDLVYIYTIFFEIYIEFLIHRRVYTSYVKRYQNILQFMHQVCTTLICHFKGWASMGDAGLRFCLKSAGSTMPSRFQGRLSPLAREALAEVMATFILVVSTRYNERFNFIWIDLLFF